MNAQELIGDLEQLAKPVKRTERGWPVKRTESIERCHFRRNTLLECGNRRVVVSTVGAMYDRQTEQFEEIGDGRYYETMVFPAKRVQRIYWDADTRKGARCASLPWSISTMQDDSDFRANEMHEAVVAHITQVFASGAKL